MPTVHREGGFRVVIYPNDHDPPHVHVIGAGEAKILLTGPEAPILYEIVGMSRSDVRRAVRIVEANMTKLLLSWRMIHG